MIFRRDAKILGELRGIIFVWIDSPALPGIGLDIRSTNGQAPQINATNDTQETATKVRPPAAPASGYWDPVCA